MASWYIGSTKWAAVTAWSALTAHSIGDLVRQNAAPAVGSERVFRCTTAGTSLASEPTWVLTAGSTTTETAGPVWTEVTGQSTYNWSAPHARLANAFASGWMAAGDTGYVSNNHAETQATAMTLTPPGTAGSPCNILCVNDAGSVPPVSADLRTTANITTTTNVSMTVPSGYCYFFGIIFNAGNGVASSASLSLLSGNNATGWLKFDTCALKLLINNTNSSKINIGTQSGTNIGDSFVEFLNTPVTFMSTGGGITVQKTRFRWLYTPSATAGTVPTILFSNGNGQGAFDVELRGVDLSAINTSLVNVAASAPPGKYAFTNCKINASVSVTNGSNPGQGGPQIEMVNCASGNTNYQYSRPWYQGNITQETTIVRTSPAGASDGTTPQSRKIVTSANSKFYSPMESAPIIFWNESTSSVTVSMAVVTDNVTLTNADAWIEVEELGTSGNPLSVISSSRASDILATPANNPTDSTSTWTTTGLTTPIKQTLSVTFTPALKGPIRARVMMAKASTTMYYDPKIIFPSGRQYMISEGFLNEGAGGGGYQGTQDGLRD